MRNMLISSGRNGLKRWVANLISFYNIFLKAVFNKDFAVKNIY